MNLPLLFVLGTVAIAVLVLAQPTARNVAAATLGTLGCVLVTACALLRPECAAAAGVTVMACALAWVAWRALTWPIRYVAAVIRSPE